MTAGEGYSPRINKVGAEMRIQRKGWGGIIPLAFVALVAMLFPIDAYAHNGGRDMYGGHFEKATGVYHCHTDTCLAFEIKVTKDLKIQMGALEADYTKLVAFATDMEKAFAVCRAELMSTVANADRDWRDRVKLGKEDRVRVMRACTNQRE